MEHRGAAGRDADARDRLAALDTRAPGDPELLPRPREHLAIDHRDSTVVVDQERVPLRSVERLRTDNHAGLHGAHDVALLGG
jgi:hypothetical protein